MLKNSFPDKSDRFSFLAINLIFFTLNRNMICHFNLLTVASIITTCYVWLLCLSQGITPPTHTHTCYLVKAKPLQSYKQFRLDKSITKSAPPSVSCSHAGWILNFWKVMTLSSPRSIIYLQNQFSQSDVEDVNHATANNGKACVCAYCIHLLDCSQHYKNLLVWEDWSLIIQAKTVVAREKDLWIWLHLYERHRWEILLRICLWLGM